MKVIIAGSRTLSNPLLITQAIEESGFEVTEVVSGCAQGVDRAGEDWAALNNIPVKRFPAKWHKHGRQAGWLRNKEMAVYADALIAIWDGKSKGTRHMIEIAKSREKWNDKISVYVKQVTVV